MFPTWGWILVAIIIVVIIVIFVRFWRSPRSLGSSSTEGAEGEKCENGKFGEEQADCEITLPNSEKGKCSDKEKNDRQDDKEATSNLFPLPTCVSKTHKSPPPFVQKQPSNMKRSIPESVCHSAITDFYNLPFDRVSPDFLRGRYGKNLELDCYNDQLKIAVEYNGEQHYKFPHPFHRTKEDFLRQVENDELKRQICEELGIYLIVVPYTVKLKDIRQFIYDRLPENVCNLKETV